MRYYSLLILILLATSTGLGCAPLQIEDSAPLPAEDSVPLPVVGSQPIVDFPFVTRDGEATTLFLQLGWRAQPSQLGSSARCASTRVAAPCSPCPSCSPVKNLPTEGSACFLLLFDPDCNECHELISQLIAIDAKVIAIFPVDEPLTEEDPNLVSYRQACEELPPTWIVGIDNGSILDGDLYIWEHLPLLIKIPSSLISDETATSYNSDVIR